MTEQAFEQQVTALTQEMYRVAAGLLRGHQDRQDAVQACVLKAWQGLPRLRDEGLFRAWLMRILINECRSLGRARRREIAAEEIEIPQEAEDSCLRDEELHRAVLALPEKLRLTVTLYYMDGLSLRETAHALRVPEGTVKGRLYQARKQLRAMLEREV